MGKIDNPLKIELDLERLGRNLAEYFTTCDPVVFTVTLDLKESQEVGRLIVRFYGTSQAYRKENDSRKTSQSWLFFFDLSPPEINNFLDPGGHQWHFKTALPAVTNASLVEEKDEKFDVSTTGYHHDAHPLPPSCDLHAEYTSALEVKAKVWYSIDAEFTRIGGKPGKLMKVEALTLLFIPLEHKPPSLDIRMIHSEIFTVQSLGLLPGRLRESDGKKELPWHDWKENKLHKNKVPSHTFKVELFARSKYVINQSLPVWIRVTHNPDGHSALPRGVPMPEVYLKEADINFWTWVHARGTDGWRFSVQPEDSVDDPVSHINLEFKSKYHGSLVIIPTKSDDPKDHGLDICSIDQEYIWDRHKNTCPDFATYNIKVKQALEVRCEIMCGGVKFDFDYQKQGFAKFGTFPRPEIEQIELVSGVVEREHSLVGRDLGDEAESPGDMIWELADPPDRPVWKDYEFEPATKW